MRAEEEEGIQKEESVPSSKSDLIDFFFKLGVKFGFEKVEFKNSKVLITKVLDWKYLKLREKEGRYRGTQVVTSNLSMDLLQFDWIFEVIKLVIQYRDGKNDLMLVGEQMEWNLIWLSTKNEIMQALKQFVN